MKNDLATRIIQELEWDELTTQEFMDLLREAALALRAAEQRADAANQRVRELTEALRDALEVGEGYASSTCQEFCVHSMDRPEQCPNNDPVFANARALLAPSGGEPANQDTAPVSAKHDALPSGGEPTAR